MTYLDPVAHPWAIVRDDTGEIDARFSNYRLALATAEQRSGPPRAVAGEPPDCIVGTGVPHHVVDPWTLGRVA